MMNAVLIVLAVSPAAIELRGDVTHARFGPTAWEFADIGDEMILTIHGFDDVSELPQVFPRATMVDISYTVGMRDVDREVEWYGTPRSRLVDFVPTSNAVNFGVEPGESFVLSGEGLTTPGSQYLVSGVFASATSSVVPETDSRLIWAIGVWIVLAVVLRRRGNNA